jgi:hypothetical protein
MYPADHAGGYADSESPVPSAAALPDEISLPSRTHLVVVTTRSIEGQPDGMPGALLRTRFWHPRDHRWSENDFESLEHVRRLFIDESGWVLRQEQALDEPMAHEMIFEAHRIDFTRSSREQILRDIGLTPDGVSRLLDRADPHG